MQEGGREETEGVRSEKMDVQMDAKRAERKTRKELEKRNEQGLLEKEERMKGGRIQDRIQDTGYRIGYRN